MRHTTLEELSAGGVVYRKAEGGGWQYLVGKHSGYHKWVLPKGLVERGEGPIETAVREVEEEVGVRARVVDLAPLKTIEYWYYAELELQEGEDAKGGKSERRVKKYQEDPSFAEASAGKVRVHKRVIFYLMELEEDLGKAGWEMEEREWVSYEEGKKKLAFESEQEVLILANNEISAPAGT